MFTPEQRELRKLKREVKEFLSKGYKCLTFLDKVMREKESFDRGRKVAKISNSLEMSLDSLAHFGLGLEFKKINRLYKKEYLKSLTKEK